jgi:hypothetical protein
VQPLNQLAIVHAPPFKHTLTDANIGKITAIQEELIIHNQQYGTSVPLASCISPALRENLCNESNVNMLHSDFQQLPDKAVLRMLRRYALPVDMVTWTNCLRTSVQFPHLDPIPSLSDFRTLYSAILSYTRAFNKACLFLLAAGPTVTPPLLVGYKAPGSKARDESIVGIYLSGFPATMGFDLHVYFFPKFDKNAFPDLDTYLRTFTRKLLELKKLVESVAPFNRILKAAQRPLPAFTPRSSLPPSQSPARPPPRVHHLDTSLENQSDTEDEAVPDLPPEPDSETDEFADSQTLLHALQPEARDLACTDLVFRKPCSKGPLCNNSHEKAIVDRARARLIDKLTQPTPGPVLSAPIRLAPQRPPDTTRPRDKVFNVLPLLAALPPSTSQALPSPAHVSATLLVSPPIRVTALLDSGALGDSYISAATYSAHKDTLAPLLIPCSDTVLLGDGTTAIPITGYINVDILFDGHAQRHPSRLKLKILAGDNTSQDILIGLPALMDSCYDLFLDVVNHLPRATLHNTCPSTDPVAPEDEITDTPVNFDTYLHYMEVGRDVALQEYLSLVDTHVDPEFLLNTPVRSLLETKGADVFVPANWEGIRDVTISLTWKDIPPRLKPPARPVNPKLLATAKTEFDRLCQYMYVPSTSDIASPLVIAPKDTPPFVRFCGDYPRINKYIEIGHFPIPHVMRELEKLAGFKLFLDLDLVNAFHQFRLDALTSERLSIVTPWGQVRPLFMPEGIGPASGILQKHMASIFSDFLDWAVILFDNMLLLAHDHRDAYDKLNKFLDRCRERNV